MKRRPFLHAIPVSGAGLLAGCTEQVLQTESSIESNEVFAGRWFDDTDLVVEFRDAVDVETVSLRNWRTDETYETIDQPGETARFRVVFPERLETYIGDAFQIDAKTSEGRADQHVRGFVHAYATAVEPLSDGRARVDLENQANAPLLVRFVGITGDVPNPTIDPLSDSVDQSSIPYD